MKNLKTQIQESKTSKANTPISEALDATEFQSLATTVKEYGHELEQDDVDMFNHAIKVIGKDAIFADDDVAFDSYNKIKLFIGKDKGKAIVTGDAYATKLHNINGIKLVSGIGMGSPSFVAVSKKDLPKLDAAMADMGIDESVNESFTEDTKLDDGLKFKDIKESVEDITESFQNPSTFDKKQMKVYDEMMALAPKDRRKKMVSYFKEIAKQFGADGVVNDIGYHNITTYPRHFLEHRTLFNNSPKAVKLLAPFIAAAEQMKDYSGEEIKASNKLYGKFAKSGESEVSAALSDHPALFNAMKDDIGNDGWAIIGAIIEPSELPMEMSFEDATKIYKTKLSKLYDKFEVDTKHGTLLIAGNLKSFNKASADLKKTYEKMISSNND